MNEASENYLSAGDTVKSWLLTTDHKRIGILYLVSILFFFAIAAFAAARHVDEGGVEHRAAALVDIEPAQQHGLDHPAGLRDAEHHHALGQRAAFQRMVAQMR